MAKPSKNHPWNKTLHPEKSAPREEREGGLPPPMCLHKSIRYDAGKDNFYCNDCHAGMGLAYYRVAKELMRVQAEGKDFQGKGLPNIERLRKGRKSLCTVRPGIGLCDDCTQPKHPQKPDRYGHMICADCDEKYGVINAFRNWLRIFDERNRDVILEWMNTPEAFPEIVKILVEGPRFNPAERAGGEELKHLPT